MERIIFLHPGKNIIGDKVHAQTFDITYVFKNPLLQVVTDTDIF